MEAPPPVNTLLKQYALMAQNLQDVLSVDGIDWRRRPAPDQWSLTEIVCHLRDVEREVHQARFTQLIEAENAFLAGVAADEWAADRQYYLQDGRQALAAFIVERQASIDLLDGLPAGLWERRGRHAFFGPTSMHELLYLAVRHDEAHWQQIGDIL